MKATARHGGIFPVVQFELSTRSTIRCAEICMDASTIEWISFPSFRAYPANSILGVKRFGGNVASMFGPSCQFFGAAMLYGTCIQLLSLAVY